MTATTSTSSIGPADGASDDGGTMRRLLKTRTASAVSCCASSPGP